MRSSYTDQTALGRACAQQNTCSVCYHKTQYLMLLYLCYHPLKSRCSQYDALTQAVLPVGFALSVSWEFKYITVTSPTIRWKCDGWQEQHLQTRRLTHCQCQSHLPSVFHLSSTDLTAFFHIVSFLTTKEHLMFSPLRTEKFYEKKIKLKDFHSTSLTSITQNLPSPRKNKRKQRNPQIYWPVTTKLSWFLVFFISLS